VEKKEEKKGERAEEEEKLCEVRGATFVIREGNRNFTTLHLHRQY
jgi:hypothetical protein